MTTTQLYQAIEQEMYEKHKEKPRVSYDVFFSNWFVQHCIENVSDYPLEKLRFVCPLKFFTTLLHCESEKHIILLATYFLPANYTIPDQVIKDFVNYPKECFHPKHPKMSQNALFEKALYDKDYHISMTMITTSTQPLDGRSWSMLNEFNKELDTTYDCRITARYLDLESIKTFYQYTEDSDSFERLLETELQ
ncbi:MAG: hypothetical protein M0P10_03975 [Sphaerochaetaceae bacterium]|nr:hypothetical protein [Sphaerochaetaceae bacterium]